MQRLQGTNGNDEEDDYDADVDGKNDDNGQHKQHNMSKLQHVSCQVSCAVWSISLPFSTRELQFKSL
eukprot:2835092-Amphidinium_carterae.1